MTSMILLACVAVRSALAAPADQQPSATFRSEVGIVEINAVVTDTNGNFVRDLKKDDFQVFEDGRLRPFSLFSLVD
ncbi:MAG: hypothetical protein ABI619_12935, partial [Betaproteobacteria bacterium]